MSGTASLVSLSSDNVFLSPPSPISSIRQEHLSVNSGSSPRLKFMPSVQVLSLQEEVGQNLSIEMDSIKQIRDDHVHPLTLQFLLPEMESTVIQTIHNHKFLIVENEKPYYHF
jgi:hypothetical protein